MMISPSKKSKTLYSKHILIADTFSETVGVCYREVWLYHFPQLHFL